MEGGYSNESACSVKDKPSESFDGKPTSEEQKPQEIFTSSASRNGGFTVDEKRRGRRRKPRTRVRPNRDTAEGAVATEKTQKKNDEMIGWLNEKLSTTGSNGKLGSESGVGELAAAVSDRQKGRGRAREHRGKPFGPRDSSGEWKGRNTNENNYHGNTRAKSGRGRNQRPDLKYDDKPPLDPKHVGDSNGLEFDQMGKSLTELPSWRRRNEGRQNMDYENSMSDATAHEQKGYPNGHYNGSRNFKLTKYPDYHYGSEDSWRSPDKQNAYFRKSPFKSRKEKSSTYFSSFVDPNHSAQGVALTEQLMSETYECMVCCEKVWCSSAIWSCTNCFHVFHLKCARKWATSATSEVKGGDGGWRCPACQNVSNSVPNVYWCFCGKLKEPRWNPREGIVPHSCGELCQKSRDINNCPHKCNLLCHPGPCPTCPVMVAKSCECGKTSQQVRCGQTGVILCTDVCEKLLNCGNHNCQRTCHSGPCDPCDVEVQQDCYCSKTTRKVLCGTGEYDIVDDHVGYFSCEDRCERVLDCSNHHCEKVCHKGSCKSCELKPEAVSHCPCGKTALTEILGENNMRQQCLDPIPTCGLKVRCIEVTSEDFLCDQRCNKKRQCGRHRCNQKCCVDTEHRCELVCGKKLRCGTHTCLELCHRGYCPPCYMTGYDEVTCHCGATILYPPIPCGTPPPNCPYPCSRQHSCSHPVNHSCHSEEVCPPCTALTQKMCAGGHELRHSIPCHVTDVSCGRRCDRPLLCGHTCSRTCHKPPCLGEQEPCTQPCANPREECDHPCGAPCHPGQPCPSVPCKVKITVSCKCGRRSDVVQCLRGGDKSAPAYQRFTTESLADKMKNIQLGQTVDISGILLNDQFSIRHIECNEDCAIQERNRRLAQALDVNPESSAFSANVTFSPFLLAEAKFNFPFIKSIEEVFYGLIESTTKGSLTQKSHAFNPMNSHQRRIIHELASHYNLCSRSYDQEPKRNTVVTATRDSRLPPVLLTSQITSKSNPAAPVFVPYLGSTPAEKPRVIKDSKPDAKSKTWVQAPDYFADDFAD
ncbi:predicted protein [Nematostella vectensis]|uniref:Transcriptional repressor NF-X1 n=1 Tax=Nematostella vectensis TaxID=45351 RepID=A7RRR1_NEMVE|nr:predicted protein [Nematostella vectensis]|eukprot:XP_001637933.1 predicted protein [Nematostella vectensis]